MCKYTHRWTHFYINAHTNIHTHTQTCTDTAHMSHNPFTLFPTAERPWRRERSSNQHLLPLHHRFIFPTSLIIYKCVGFLSTQWCVFGLGPSAAGCRVSPNYQRHICPVIFNFTGILGTLKGGAELPYLCFSVDLYSWHFTLMFFDKKYSQPRQSHTQLKAALLDFLWPLGGRRTRWKQQHWHIITLGTVYMTLSWYDECLCLDIQDIHGVMLLANWWM